MLCVLVVYISGVCVGTVYVLCVVCLFVIVFVGAMCGVGGWFARVDGWA